MTNELTNYEYDNWLASRSNKSRSARDELKARTRSRRSKGYEGWHFGLGDTPVYTRDKTEFKRELEKRNLMLRDDVRKELK